MNNNSFLENLKNAVETGEFNSEAANKIKQINELANTMNNFSESELNEKVEKRIESNIKTVTEEEAVELNSLYEKQMETIRLTDLTNKQLATLIEIEKMVELSINDMINHIDNTIDELKKEHDENNIIFEPIFTKVSEIMKKYNTFINK